MDFNNRVLWTIELFGLEVWITETIFNTWIVMAVLIGFAIAVRLMLKHFRDIPAGFQNAVEMAVEYFDKFVKAAVGEKFMYLGNWFFMVFAFILVSSLAGLLGLRPPTSDFATTFALALVTFGMIQVLGIAYRRGKYLKSFFEPYFIFFPLNVIGELARPVSLSFRLFGNVLAGTIMMSLLYGLLPVFLRFVWPAALHAFFDLFAGVLQTYIFCILSLTFIAAAARKPELD